ncbi:hypothetical protein BESB_082130 [Besnoitia besnoiti]|uniref:Transmembrane protein n=1 Tax=Besnoitia besnoiti TaxID=94643 RepID=A0A2A9M744_BESBE|nr:hypothetical protein BESB_082130 [Besnoitia besnoiti]PFH33014.1 hypothetical protein BESB_082130 [Besnoitia besnoiti]
MAEAFAHASLPPRRLLAACGFAAMAFATPLLAYGTEGDRAPQRSPEAATSPSFSEGRLMMRRGGARSAEGAQKDADPRAAAKLRPEDAVNQLMVELLEDNAEYQALQRRRHLENIVKRYADEESVHVEDHALFQKERQRLLRLDKRWNMWVTLLGTTLLLTLAASGSALFREHFYGEWQDTPAERLHEKFLTQLLWATAFLSALVSVFANWRRQRTNKKFTEQGARLERMTYEAGAGVDPQREPLLGPTAEDEKRHQREMRKRAATEQQ